MQEGEETKEERRPPIPQPMQRAVRQRCSFGCVICGHPLYEYHHMAPYAEVQKHEEDNLTLLCDSHHREATVGLLTSEQVAAANASPYNVTQGVSAPFALNFSGTEFQVEIGSNHLVGGTPHPEGGFAFIPISVDDNDILWFRVDENGRIFFNMEILDECNLPLLVINENALMYKTDIWDILFQGTKLTIRQAARNIFLEIEFCPPNGIRILRGRLLCNGVEILVRKTHILIVNAGQMFRDCTLGGGAIGLQLGRNQRGYRGILRSDPHGLKRYGVDREAALKMEKDAIQKFESLFGKST